MGMNTNYIASSSASVERSTLFMDLELEDDGLRLRTLDGPDVALLVEATSGEPGRSLWGPHLGPYSPSDAEAALADWAPAKEGQFSLGVIRNGRLLGAIGLIPDRPGSIELAYWLQPEERGKGIASHAARAATRWAHDVLAVPRIWLEIEPGNEPSQRLAQRIGFEFDQLIPKHCRTWTHPDAEHDTWHDCLIWTHEAAPDRS
ncbi:GNAT family N-acetyltransferase [Spirillospora sp. NPDC052269]